MGIALRIGGLAVGSSGSSWMHYLTPQYQLVLDAKTTQPSSADKRNEAKWLKRMIDGGYYAKAELLDMFSADTQANSLFDWKNPAGTHNPSMVNTPEHEPYRGFRGSTSSAIRLNYIPSSDHVLISDNNMCVIIGVGDNRSFAVDDFGASNAGGNRLSITSRYPAPNLAYFRMNKGTAISVANTNSIKYYIGNRVDNLGSDSYLNKVKTHTATGAGVLIDKELYACGFNGSVLSFGIKILRFVFIFSGLTDAEIYDILDITEEYLSNYKSNLINYTNLYAVPDKASKTAVTLTTYDGSGQTCHPSVVNVGSEWNGYQYWMANTPYPATNPDYENPSIWASADGATWVVPAGLTNPIVPKPATFNADTDIFYNADDNKLYVIYKVVGVTKIISSTDGVNWGNIKTVLTLTADETECASPSLIKIGSKFYIYYRSYQTTALNNVHYRRVSCDTIDGTYGNIEELTLPYAGIVSNVEKKWWHFDIININGIYYMPAINAPGATVGADVIMLRSVDGLTFVKDVYPMVDGQDSVYDAAGYYRPTLAIIGTQPTLYYATLTTGTAVWGLAKISINLI